MDNYIFDFDEDDDEFVIINDGMKRFIPTYDNSNFSKPLKIIIRSPNKLKFKSL